MKVVFVLVSPGRKKSLCFEKHDGHFHDVLHRGGAHGVRRPLVVHGRSQTGVPQHQQLCHASDGDPSLPGRSLPLQLRLSLSEGNEAAESEPRAAPITCIRSLFERSELAGSSDSQQHQFRS